MNRFDRIKSQVSEVLNPVHLELVDESSQHSVPRGSESHFKLLVVSEQFKDLNRVERQRKVYSLLDGEFKNGLHALSLRALTPEEWQKTQEDEFQSPQCLGGSKKN